MIPDSIEKRFAREKPIIEAVAKEVRATVQTYCTKHGFAFAERNKEAQSISDKIETGRFDRWSELDDLYACCIIVPTLTEEEGAVKFLRDVFLEVEIRRRGRAAKAPDVFRFDSTRFIGRLRCPPGAEPGSEHMLKFEVQVRSAFEHAWSVTTHRLVYKGEAVEWGRLRLAAQLKAAVEQLDLLVIAFDEAATQISESEWAEVEARKESVSTIRGLVDADAIPKELAPHDWARFSSNLYEIFCASRGSPRDYQKRAAFVSEGLAQIRSEIETVGSAGVPRGVSLLQFAFAILAKRGVIRAPLHSFVAPVTVELAELFEQVTDFGEGMDLEG